MNNYPCTQYYLWYTVINGTFRAPLGYLFVVDNIGRYVIDSLGRFLIKKV